MHTLYSWGYQSRSIKELDALLHEHSIAQVVDVRRRAWAKYQPDFQGSKIQQHFIRHPKASYQTLGRYLGNMHRALPWKKPPDWQQGMDELDKLLRQQNVLLLCLERDPASCHRSEIAQILQEFNKCEVVHLGWPTEKKGQKKAKKEKKKNPNQLTLF